MDKQILDKLHSTMLEIYKEIEKVCLDNNLTFFVVGGTLLGAVVHKDYIPWDDDLDIAMPRDDYEKFMSICPDALSNRLYLHHTSTDPDYWLSFAKVRMHNTIFLEEKRKNIKENSGIYVDIFPFDYAPSCNRISHKIKWKIVTYLNNYLYCFRTGVANNSASFKLTKLLCKRKSIKQISEFRDQLMKSFDNGERRYFVDLAGGRKLNNSYFPIDKLLPTHTMPFGKTTVIVPKNPNYYLLQLYTEKYKIIPPENERITHEPLMIRFEDGQEVYFDE